VYGQLGKFEALHFRFTIKPKQTFLLLIFFFVKRQNFVLALPAQRTGLSHLSLIALLAIHLVVQRF
jgi:hypothetical protein|tara:strand:- start:1073 stop:1270 length:198 start_codon:yes stop_codon:yes gene_type:complete